MNPFAFMRTCRPVWLRQTIIEKECRRCHERKSLDRFHRNHKMRDGHLNVCKACRHG